MKWQANDSIGVVHKPITCPRRANLSQWAAQAPDQSTKPEFIAVSGSKRDTGRSPSGGGRLVLAPRAGDWGVPLGYTPIPSGWCLFTVWTYIRLSTLRADKCQTSTISATLDRFASPGASCAGGKIAAEAD
jgi:hypothetical protein